MSVKIGALGIVVGAGADLILGLDSAGIGTVGAFSAGVAVTNVVQNIAGKLITALAGD